MAKTKRKHETVTPAADHRADRGIYYRCPACGVEVDGTDRSAVSLHHQHFLHPHLFRRFHSIPGR
jgi:hypothetical protein